MLELPHVLVGATIATLIPNPIISLSLSLASHFITDYVPHWNPHIGSEKKKYGHILPLTVAIIVIDSVLALIIGTYLSSRFLPNTNQFIVTMLCCFMAVAPDVVEAPYIFLGIRNTWIEKLLSFQKSHQWNVPIFWGLLSQAAVIAICLYLTLSA
jgi:hypothetical protein